MAASSSRRCSRLQLGVERVPCRIAPYRLRNRRSAAPLAVQQLAEMAETALESDAGGTDIITSILFTAATVALSLITLGVAYLSFLSWQDSTTEEQDRQRIRGKPMPVGEPKPVGGEAEADGGSKKAKRKPQAAASSKGFGTKQ
eukprot:scaffold1.g5829.t1